MEDKINDKKILSFVIRLSISIIIAFVLVAGGTLAYWQWASTESKNVVFNTVSGFEEYVVYDAGKSYFTGSFEEISDFCESASTTLSVYKTRDDIDFSMTINMDINSIGNSISNSSNVYWIVTKGTDNIVCNSGVDAMETSGKVISYGTFNGKSAPSSFAMTEPITITSDIQKYTVWIWISDDAGLVSGETIDTNIWSQIDMLDQTDSVDLSGEAYAVYSEDDNSLRFYRSKTPITINSTYNGLTVTNVYTGFETANYMEALEVPWVYCGAETVVFEDYVAPVSTAIWFFDMTLTSIDLTKLYTLNTINMNNMFESSRVDTLDVSSFDTSKVTNMHSMFYFFEGNIVGLENFDTSNVTDMGGMFVYATGNYDLTIWNVCKVVDYGNFADDGSAFDSPILEPYFGDSSKCRGKDTNSGITLTVNTTEITDSNVSKISLYINDQKIYTTRYDVRETVSSNLNRTYYNVTSAYIVLEEISGGTTTVNGTEVFLHSYSSSGDTYDLLQLNTDVINITTTMYD